MKIENMTTYTLRTEFESDIPRAVNLLEILNAKNIREKTVSDPLCEWYKMGIITFKSGRGIKSLKATIMRHSFGHHEQFADLHRCAQTLAIGEEPNNEWYLEK